MYKNINKITEEIEDFKIILNRSGTLAQIKINTHQCILHSMMEI
jgi:hypothetical protein